MQDAEYMKVALELAAKAMGRTSPNPLVGALVVKEDEIMGRGYHKRAGELHAEPFALAEAGEASRGATLYVSLEPCSHQGRTPPCVDSIIAAGIKKVVAAMEDPNPRVAGRGIKKLKDAGIEVKVGILEDEAKKLNESFIKFITTGRPFVAVKSASSLDGKIATQTGHSRWITGEKSREWVHHLRDRHDAILTGIGTVLKDDPLLTTRLPEGGRDPLRVVVDSYARISLDAAILNVKSAAKTLVAVTKKAPKSRVLALQEKGVEVLILPQGEGGVDLRALMQELGAREVTSLMVEAGGSINYSLLAAGLVDKVYCFLAPVIIGGREAPTSFAGDGVKEMAQAWQVEDIELAVYGTDMLFTGYIRKEAKQ